MILCVVGSFKFVGCCGFPLSHFGHDRAKNDPGIDFPYPSYELLVCCMYAVVGLRACLINMGCLGAT